MNQELNKKILFIISFIIFSFFISTKNVYAASILKTIDVDAEPGSISIDKEKNKIYIVKSGFDVENDKSLDGILVIDGSSNTVLSQLNPCLIRCGIAINSSADKIYGSSCTSEIDIVSIEKNSCEPLAGILTYVATDNKNVEFNSKTNKIYATSKDAIVVLNGFTNEKIKTIETASFNTPNDISINEETNKIYALDSKNLTVINGETDTLESTISIFHIDDFSSIAINSKTNNIYASGSSSSLKVINGFTNKVSQTKIKPINIGFATDIAVNSNSNEVYLFDKNLNLLIIVDGASNKIKDLVHVEQTNSFNAFPVFQKDIHLSLNPNSNLLYISNPFYNMISVIDTTSEPETEPINELINDSKSLVEKAKILNSLSSGNITDKILEQAQLIDETVTNIDQVNCKKSTSNLLSLERSILLSLDDLTCKSNIQNGVILNPKRNKPGCTYTKYENYFSPVFKRLIKSINKNTKKDLNQNNIPDICE
jgi:DNA-binding beta-propeller fold protein YncE